MNGPDKTWLELEPEARAWLLRLRSGEATADDVDAFRRWCAQRPEHAKAARMLSRSWNTMDTALANVLAEDAQAGRKLATPKQARTGRRAFVGAALAAGASWLALRPPLQLWPSVVDLAADYRTGTGEQRQVALSDRVLIEMNTQTRINLANAQSGQTSAHEIQLLAGEAEIIARAPSARPPRPVRPIAVVAGQGRLRALVAQFNVRRTGDQVCVTCVSGEVALEHRGRQLTLSATQQIVYDENGLRPAAQVNPVAATAWREGVLIFDDVPLAEVIDEINRYRPGKLILRNPDLGSHLMQARLSIHDLDAAVEMIRVLSGAHLTKLPGNIVLVS